MFSSPTNANFPRIPGRCDICGLKDGKNKMNFVQCKDCKICVHRECYKVSPADDFDYINEFVCFACAAVGEKVQAVDTHLSNQFYEIEQKERPIECALCNVSHGLHAMFPLFDYHGQGGRQICYPVKDKKKKYQGKRDNNKSNNNDDIIHTNDTQLAWGHALCCLYLATLGHLYACYKDGDFIGMEDEDNIDVRPPNPELVVTEEFQRMYGDQSMPHYRYYMTPLDSPPCDWTKAVIERKRLLRCIECGSDDKKSLRIPVQCVANDSNEFSEHKTKHNKDEPCKQALHVGCARWAYGGKQSTVQKVYFFPGLCNDDGSIRSNLDTVTGVYCKMHAEDLVHPELQERTEKQNSKNQAAEKDEKERRIMHHHVQQPEQQKQNQNFAVSRQMKALPNTAKKLLSSTFLPGNKKSDSINKLTYTNSNFGKKTASAPASAPRKQKPRDRLAWAFINKNKHDRYEELDSSVAVAINAGEKPTLAKRRRELANEKSIVDDSDIDKIFDDLVLHSDEIAAKNTTGILNSRRYFWKHKFSELSTSDFDSIWKHARNKFFLLHQNEKSQSDSKEKNVIQDSSNSIDMASMASEGKKEKDSTSKTSTENGKQVPNVNTNYDIDRHDDDDDVVMDTDDDDSHSDSETIVIKKNKTSDVSKVSEEKKMKERPSDQWSKLFIGQKFRLGCEFTLDEWEIDEKL